ncbi:MAG: T9SS type A sorting domain-containing protein [Candidatus Cloacimonetes bacterium]|jgi:predicted outer membrane repeat protein|nr:T9SS type A sorting domain-containing protein [Candidatus Cloacimonadota bacterium]
MKKTFLVILVLFCTNSWLNAIVINVPADYETIQAGLDVATEGDSVLVAAGTYVENIIWPAVNGIKLIGSGEEDCIIDGNENGRVITITGVGFLISKFTIQNGHVNVVYPDCWGGGGIYCGYSSPSLVNLTITGNNATGTLARGGGISIEYSNPSLENVTVTNNSASYDGGGIYCRHSTSSFENMIISGNVAGRYGGGIQCVAYLCTTLENVLISDNSASTGGGIDFDCSEASLVNVKITGNSASNGGGGVGCGDAGPSFENVMISNNSAPCGGGIYSYYSYPMLTNVTITDNSADDGSGIYSLVSEINLANCILWNDSPDEIYFDTNYAPNSILIAYSDIQGGYAGEGNIDLDPLFVDAANGDYHLTEFSPCIDAGDPTSPFDPDGTIADMGAFYYHQDVGINDNELAVTNYQLANYPNPFNPTTTISFSLSAENMENAEIKIFNIKGQLVETLQITNSPNQQIIWNAEKQASGVYFYKLVVDGNPVDTKKMILLK